MNECCSSLRPVRARLALAMRIVETSPLDTGLIAAIRGAEIYPAGGPTSSAIAVSSSSGSVFVLFILYFVSCFDPASAGRSLSCCGREKWEPSRRLPGLRLLSLAPSRLCAQSAAAVGARRACDDLILADAFAWASYSQGRRASCGSKRCT
jgi:hypothetical protein